MTVVDTLDQSALRRETATESERRRCGQIWWNHGRSSTWGATPMTVVDTLDQSTLRRETATESGRRRRGQIWWNHGRSSTSPPIFCLTWNWTWCDA